jgi:hypothetical protein
MACADVATAKAKPAAAINFVIVISLGNHKSSSLDERRADLHPTR